MIIRVRVASGEIVNIPAREIVEVRELANGYGLIVTRSGTKIYREPRKGCA